MQPKPAARSPLAQINVWLDLNQPPSTPVKLSPGISSRRRAFNTIGIPILALVAFLGLARLWTARPPQPSNENNPQIAVITSPTANGSGSTAQKGTVQGAVTERVLPNISQGARNTIHGKIRVTVRLTVDASGNVTEANLTSAGPSKYFANQALQSARRWKIRPPQVDGQLTSSVWLLKYQFGRSGTEVLPSEVR